MSHVQFVSYDSMEDVGGVSSWLRRLLPSLRGSGIDARIDLFCFDGKPGSNAEWFQKAGVPFRWAPWMGQTEEAVQQCLAWLGASPPAVYVPNCILPAYFAASEAKHRGVRVVGTLHSDDPFYWGLVDEFIQGDERWRVGEWVVVSRYLEDTLLDRKSPAVAIQRIPYGVPKESVVERVLEEKVRIVYAGRLVDEQKRVTEVAKAMCRVVGLHPNLEAWIVGTGSEEQSVIRIITEAGMHERVLMKGRVAPERMSEVFNQCHIFVLLSDFEGTPVALLEAMAAGCVPVCLKARSGIGDVIQHGKNGLIVEDREQSFSDAVALLLSKPKRWAEFSLAAQRTISESYSEEECFARWERLMTSQSHVTKATGCFASRIKLPRRNSKFGYFDQRKMSLFGRILRRIRREMTPKTAGSIGKEG